MEQDLDLELEDEATEVEGPEINYEGVADTTEIPTAVVQDTASNKYKLKVGEMDSITYRRLQEEKELINKRNPRA